MSDFFEKGVPVHTGSSPDTHSLPVTATTVASWINQLAEGDLPSNDTDRIELIALLERLGGAAASAQARATVAFDRSQRAEQRAAGTPASRRGIGIAHQLGLARHVSPSQAKQMHGLAITLDHELPCTAEALRHGRISQWRAMIIARETAALSSEHRAAVDRELAGDISTLEAMGDRELAGRAAALAAQLDPASVVVRRRKAEADRRVGLRPAPDTMSHLSGLLPVADGVAVFAALSRAADSARSRGDERTRGQLMADTLVDRILERTTTPSKSDTATQGADTTRHVGGHAASLAEITWESCDTEASPGPVTRPAQASSPVTKGSSGLRRAHAEVNVMINLVMTDQQLFAGTDGAAWLDGYGPIDAEAARELAHSDQTWLRRCFSDPDTATLIAAESRSRFFPPGLKHLIRLRDRTCRTPWCDAPIRHTDHVRDHDIGGPTSLGNGQGLCEACNHAKQAPRWQHLSEEYPAGGRVTDDRFDRRPTGLPPLGKHEVMIITPTGHTYLTHAPGQFGVPRRPREVWLAPDASTTAKPSRRLAVDVLFSAA